jgi:hypothetical protein
LFVLLSTLNLFTHALQEINKPVVIENKTKCLSWKAISSDALAKTTPLKPPIVNMNTKPKANNIEGVNCKDPP